MMKWGGRKTFFASGPSTFMSRAPLFSWLSKFKHMRIFNSEPNHGKMKHKAKQNSTTSLGSSPQYSCGNGGGFYVRDGDALWRTRPSFGDESHVDKKSEEDVDGSSIPSSSFPNGRSRRYAKKHGTREDTLKFKEKDIGLGLGEEIKLLDDRKVSLEMDEYNREKEYEHLSRFERKAQRVLQEQEAAEEVEFASSKVEEKNVLQLESPRTICTPRAHSFASFADSSRSNFKVGSIVDCYEKAGRQSQKKSNSDQRQKLKQTEGLKVKTTNKKRQTLDVSREPQRRKPKHSPRFRIYSPRMASRVEACRIKALEDMRKAKLKMMRKEVEEEVVEGAQGSDSFAVIKCSSDPKQEFRDSMIEMIMEKQIRHPEEMEELLACYLTLNADEYHNLIIKVFRQVWFGMSQDGSCGCE